MRFKQSHKPPMTGNGNYTTYIYGDDWGMVYCWAYHIKPHSQNVYLGNCHILKNCSQMFCLECIISGWWFGTCFFQFIGNNNPNWRFFSRGVGQPPTRYPLRFPPEKKNGDFTNWVSGRIIMIIPCDSCGVSAATHVSVPMLCRMGLVWFSRISCPTHL